MSSNANQDDCLNNEHERLESEALITPYNNENAIERLSENEEINILEGEVDSWMSIIDDNEEFIQPLHLNMRHVNDPPRISMDPLLAGYNPFRSDFEIEYDNKAESVLGLLYYGYNDWEGSEDDELIVELKAAIVEGYNLRLKERMKRKRTIREHGLISIRKHHTWSSRKEVSYKNCF